MILVTGGSSGIGRAAVESLVSSGHTVQIADLVEPEDADTVDYTKVDVGDLDSVGLAVTEWKQKGLLFDGLVHAAGISQPAPLEELAREDWLHVLAVDLIGVIALTQGILPLLREGASLVYVTSAAIHKGLVGHSVYLAAKGGLHFFASGLASDLGPRGIRVNTVAPGLIDTPLTRKHPLPETFESAMTAQRAISRRGKADDLVGTIRFLLSEESSFITGQSLVVDGGIVRR